MEEVLGGFDGEAAVGVDGALGLAGGSGGVDEHHGGVGVDDFGLAEVGGRGGTGGEEVVEGQVVVGGGGEPGEDDEAGVACTGGGGNGGGEDGGGLAAAEGPVGGEEDGGVAVGEAGGGGIDTEAGEEGDEDAAGAEDGEHGDDDLGDEGHHDGGGLAGPEAERAEAGGSAFDLFAEVAVGELAGMAGFVLEGDGRVVVLGGAGVAVEEGLGDVHAPADAPPGEGQAFGQVEDGGVGGAEDDAELAEDGVPEPSGVGDGLLVKLGGGGEVVALAEVGEVGVGDVVGGRVPEVGFGGAVNRLRGHLGRVGGGASPGRWGSGAEHGGEGVGGEAYELLAASLIGLAAGEFGEGVGGPFGVGVGGVGDEVGVGAGSEGGGDGAGVAVGVAGGWLGEEEVGRCAQPGGGGGGPAGAVDGVEADPDADTGVVCGGEEGRQAAGGEADEADVIGADAVGVGLGEVGDELGDGVGVAAVVGPGGEGGHGDDEALSGEVFAPSGHVHFAAREAVDDEDERAGAGLFGEVEVEGDGAGGEVGLLVEAVVGGE